MVYNEVYRGSRLYELELLNKWWLNALRNLQYYQNHLRPSYNKKIKIKNFQVGDLVLKENQKHASNVNKKSKFEPNWLRPFFIACQLLTLECEALVEPMKKNRLKKFYT